MDKKPRKPSSASASYSGLKSASKVATQRAKKSSIKRDTRPEIVLRKHLYKCGLRFRIDVKWLAGRPDIVLARAKVAVFVDGDFWHGKNLKARLAKLSRGHNAAYWTRKILTNVRRDRRNRTALRRLGWSVVRVWETDVCRNPQRVADKILAAVKCRQADHASRLKR